LDSNTSTAGAVTPTAGGLVFFGDMGGNFYALDAATGQKLWGQKIGGAIGGGVITYTASGAQKVAVATGYTSPAFLVEVRRAQIAYPRSRGRRHGAMMHTGAVRRRSGLLMAAGPTADALAAETRFTFRTRLSRER
jgi:PQQ enzyme repeat